MPTRLDLLRAFPRSLERTVIPAIDSLGEDYWTSEETLDPIDIAGERIEIPRRIHGVDLEGAKTIAAKAKVVRACLLSRHHDGHVREAQVETIFELVNEWSFPYLVQLTGAYVVSIHEAILGRVETIPRSVIDTFAAENPKFVQKTKQRVISYWVAYHRGSIALEDLAATKVIEAFGWWRSSDLPMRRQRQKWRS